MKTRISCTALARITDDEGKIALLVARTPERVIMRPPGGSLESGSGGRSYLVQHCNATAFEGSRELRFVVPDTRIAAVEAWFRTRQLRETGVLHTLNHRLIDELRLLNGGDARHLTQHVRAQTQHRARTVRSVPVQDTLYLIEVFDVGMPPAVLEKLKRAAQGDRGLVYFASPREIQEQSRPGGIISSIAPCLLVGAA